MSEALQPKHPISELLARYRAVFMAAWAHRTELAGPGRMADELAFLPAALSLQETPVHPAPRRLAWGLMILFVLALLWAIVGHVDALPEAETLAREVGGRWRVSRPIEISAVCPALSAHTGLGAVAVAFMVSEAGTSRASGAA